MQQFGWGAGIPCEAVSNNTLKFISQPTCSPPIYPVIRFQLLDRPYQPFPQTLLTAMLSPYKHRTLLASARLYWFALVPRRTPLIKNSDWLECRLPPVPAF